MPLRELTQAGWPVVHEQIACFLDGGQAFLIDFTRFYKILYVF